MENQIAASSQPGLVQELLKRHLETMKPAKVKVKMTLKPARGATNQWQG